LAGLANVVAAVLIAMTEIVGFIVSGGVTQIPWS
jgi:hypothetical protein